MIRDRSELMQELQNQINLLESSIINFDQGQFIEGKRIATSLRILLHDTNSSCSLLNQLEVKDKLYFFDVARYYDGKNLLSEYLLLNILAPRLCITPKTPAKKFDEWWKQQVVMSMGGIAPQKTFSRRDLVLFLANQDGGAHVDPNIDSEYYSITRHNKGGWIIKNGSEEIPISNNGINFSIRTIAFEVCLSLHRANSALVFRTINEN